MYSESRENAFISTSLLYFAEIRFYSQSLVLRSRVGDPGKKVAEKYVNSLFVANNRIQDNCDTLNSNKSSDMMAASKYFIGVLRIRLWTRSFILPSAQH